MRFVDGRPLCPIGYIQTREPMYKKKSICKYTPEGRAEIHRRLNIDVNILNRLLQFKEWHESVEFADNRISLYTAQRGRCAVTGQILSYDEIHCHHITPRESGGTDRYDNLIILHSDVHRLVHAKQSETIAKYLKMLNLNCNMLKKVNRLREKAGLLPI